MLSQQREVLVVACARRHLDVEVAALLLREEVARAVQGEGRHARLVLEEDRAAVALVHVEVDD